MRPTITAAYPPIEAETYDALRESLHTYLEAFWRRVPPPHPERLATQARRLSEIYNHLSPQTPYGRPELSDARLHFFMPTDIVKPWGPLLELMPSAQLLERNRLSILDLGGGTGTGSVSCALVLAALGFKGHVTFTVVEPDVAVNRHLKTTFAALQDCGLVAFDTTFDTVTIEDYLTRQRDRSRFDLVLIVNVLSEAFDDEEYVDGASRWFKRLVAERVKSTGFLVVLEPALKRFSRMLSQASDQCRADGLALLAPCQPATCPQLARPNGFCFHSMRAPLTPLLQSVSARSGLDRHEVNFAYLTFGTGKAPLPRPELPPGEVLGRVVSFPRRVKKGFNYHLCTLDGLLVGYAPRLLNDDTIKGGKLPIGTIVTIAPK
jgi:hypothetical protein